MRNPNGIILLTVWLGQTLLPVAAQEAPAAQGPIDITANEQEFSGESVIARGNVRVVYKDSVILAPQATLFRDAGGNPNKAIFTGHPRLTQGTNRIDAEMLTFEIAAQKIIASGRAHSEVESSSDESEGTAGLGSESGAKAKDGKPAAQKVERIITDSDKQEYDQATGRFEAIGHVNVKHGDINVKADKLQLVYGADNKPETAVFTGNVTATQNKNSTAADNITYSLTTRRLQATGNVRSKVIQEKKETAKKPGPTASADFLTSAANAAPTATAPAASKKAIAFDGSFEAGGEEKPLFIDSDTQDYSKDNGRVSANGHVKVTYGETVGIGPVVVLTRTADGQPDKVYFNGRSQISQPGRRWIADQITFIVAEKRVIASGNSKAMILQTKPQQPFAPTAPAAPVARPNEKLAEKAKDNQNSNSQKPKPAQLERFQPAKQDYQANFPVQM